MPVWLREESRETLFGGVLILGVSGERGLRGSLLGEEQDNWGSDGAEEGGEGDHPELPKSDDAVPLAEKPDQDGEQQPYSEPARVL